MTEPDTMPPRSHDRHPSGGIAVVVALSIPVGLGLSIFGVFGWCIGPLLLGTGAVGQRLHREWARWLIWIGVGLTLGALAYVTIGLFTLDGPTSGSGSGTSLD